MNREEVMEMAYESGMIAGYEGEPDLLERFAALVAAAEREACAKVCDAEAQSREEAAHKTHGAGSPAYGRQMAGVNAAKNCAAAIRARGNT
jgi:hypothetical protein